MTTETSAGGVRTTSKLKVVEQLRERELLRAVDRDGAERQRRKVEGQHEVVHARDRGLEYCDYHLIQHELTARQVDRPVEEEEGKSAYNEGGRSNIGLLGAGPPFVTVAPSDNASERVTPT